MTPEEILAVLCPNFLTTFGYEVYIELSTNQTDATFFGSNYNYAIALRAAHMWTLDTKRGGQSGVIVGQVEGKLSRFYGGVGVIRKDLELTNYGMQLISLIRETQPGVSVASMDAINAL